MRMVKLVFAISLRSFFFPSSYLRSYVMLMFACEHNGAFLISI